MPRLGKHKEKHLSHILENLLKMKEKKSLESSQRHKTTLRLRADLNEIVEAFRK